MYGHRGRTVRAASIQLALTAAATAVALCSAPANAATVNALNGQVLVNDGKGYRLVDRSTYLGPGGTVVANPGAVAQVVYGGGCRVTVEPGSVYLIAARPPCRTGESTDAGGLPDDKGGETGGGGSGTGWALGAAAVAAGGAAAYFLLMPTSP